MGLRSILLAIMWFMLFSLPAQAADNVLRVSFNSFPPSKVKTEDGSYGGSDIDMLRLLAGRMGLLVEFEDVPFKRGLKLVEYGDIDLMVWVLRRPEREQYAYFLTPPYANKTDKALYMLKGREQTVTRYEDLHGLVVGTQIGTKYFPRFDDDKDITKFAVKDLLLNIRMLRAGRIDAFIVSEVRGDEALAGQGLMDVIAKTPFTYTEPQEVYMILSKRSPLVPRLEEFNRVMEELVDAGEFDRILKAQHSRAREQRQQKGPIPTQLP
jgi:polar amino acid transport system substrate-binding protein